MQNSKFKIQKLNSKVKSFLLFLVILPFAFCLLPLSPARATTMSNPNYILQIDQIDEVQQKIPQFPTPSPDKTPEKPYTIITSGSTFGFSISETNIDFGQLSPTNPVIRTNDLSIYSPENGYTLFGYENHQLTTSGNGIPDTTCDEGFCTEDKASIWNNILTYGFGFRCDNVVGDSCVSDFSQEDFFRQFADKSHAKNPQIILRRQGKDINAKARITYKLNVSSSFKKASYSNIITYIAVPNF